MGLDLGSAPVNQSVRGLGEGKEAGGGGKLGEEGREVGGLSTGLGRGGECLRQVCEEVGVFEGRGW